MAESNGLFTLTEQGFRPHDDRGRELHSRLLAGANPSKPVFMTVRTARNPEFSAMAHSVFTKIADGIGVPMEAVKMYLKERCGLYDTVLMPAGDTVKVYKSMSFSAMSEEQFRTFWEGALPIITGELLGGVSSKEADEIVRIIGGT